MKSRWMRMGITAVALIFLCWGMNLLAQEEETTETEDVLKPELEVKELPKAEEEAIEEAEKTEVPIERPMGELSGERAEGMKESLGLGTTEESGVQKVIYVVQTGDTLWDIAKRFMNSPYYWPKVWERNAFIIDPDLIYPGDVLNLYPTGEKLSAEFAEAEMVTIPELGEGMDTGIITKEGRIQKVIYRETSSTGYIETGEYEKAGMIVDSLDHKELLGEPDRVYVNIGENLGVSNGDVFSIFEAAKEVRHPVTKKLLGYKIINLGELKLIDTMADSSEAQIINSYREIETNDLIRPYSAPLSVEIPVVKSTLQIKGYIVEPKENAVTFGRGDIVYIDKGKEHGIEQGNVLDIYIPGEEIPKKGLGKKYKAHLPDKIIGRIIVVDPRTRTSVALITESIREIQAGMAFFLETQP